VEGLQRKNQGIRSSIGADHVLDTYHRAQSSLEFQNGWTDGELARPNQGANVVEDGFGLDRTELAVEIVVGDSHTSKQPSRYRMNGLPRSPLRAAPGSSRHRSAS